MDVLIERCAGLDVHRDTVVATVRSPGGGGGRRARTRTFSTTTGALVELADWLEAERVTLVGMESTGVYWKPVFYTLEELADWLEAERVTLVGMESTGVYWKPVFYTLEERMSVWLLNAQHLRNVPGRKTDLLTELPGGFPGWRVRLPVVVASTTAALRYIHRAAPTP